MGHYDGKRYHLKLNKEDINYEKLINKISLELKSKIIEDGKDPGESFNATIKEAYGELIVSIGGYKSQVSSSLSLNVINEIKKNIQSDIDNKYFYIEDNGEYNGQIIESFGFANKVLKFITKNQYESELYEEEDIKKFHDFLYNASEFNLLLNKVNSQKIKV